MGQSQHLLDDSWNGMNKWPFRGKRELVGNVVFWVNFAG
jgi:hypothetical protein